MRVANTLPAGPAPMTQTSDVTRVMDGRYAISPGTFGAVPSPTEESRK